MVKMVKTVQNGQKWSTLSKVVKDGQNGLKWSKIVQNGGLDLKRARRTGLSAQRARRTKSRLLVIYKASPWFMVVTRFDLDLLLCF